jgi:hypothetical protein
VVQPVPWGSVCCPGSGAPRGARPVAAWCLHATWCPCLSQTPSCHRPTTTATAAGRPAGSAGARSESEAVGAERAGCWRGRGTVADAGEMLAEAAVRPSWPDPPHPSRLWPFPEGDGGVSRSACRGCRSRTQWAGL